MPVEAPARPDRTSRELEALIEEARRRARRRRVGYAAGVIAVLLGVGGALLFGGGDDADRARDEGSPRSSAATAPSDLLFVRAAVGSAHGVVYDEGVFAVDVATGKVKRLRLPYNCGDTPFCLISTGGELVVSSAGRTIAYDPAARGRSKAARLGNGWITIPSATDGRVWLGILARGKLGGPYRRGLGAVREVDLDGDVVRSMRPPNGEWPVGAVGSGLLFEEGSSLRLWDVGEGRFTTRIPGVFATATSGSLVASCRDDCPRYFLTDTRTGAVTRIAPPAGYRWRPSGGGAFSLDGSQVALAIAGRGDGRAAARSLAVVDVRTLATHVVPASAGPAIAWSTSGDHVFFVDRDGTVMSYSVGSESLTAHAKFDSDDAVLQMVSVRRGSP